MKVFALWHGGSGYGHSDYADIERFSSVKAAKEALQDRRDCGNGTKQWFEYVGKASEHVFTPGVEDDSEMWLWGFVPDDTGDLYPNTVLSFGPNGGISEVPA